MLKNKKFLRTSGVVLFYAGILVGMLTFILMNWAYLEAYFYFGPMASADARLTTLRCPLLMTTSDTGEVTIRLTNNTTRDVSPLISTEISYYGAATLEKTNYPLAAGETRTLSWTVTSDDMVFGHLIMARVFVFRTYTLPSRSNTCGTVVIDLPGLTGRQLFFTVLAFILFCMAAGWILWIISNRLLQTEELIARRAMLFFTVIVLAGLTAGYFGWWLLGLVCAVASVLLLLVVIGYYLQKK